MSASMLYVCLWFIHKKSNTLLHPPPRPIFTPLGTTWVRTHAIDDLRSTAEVLGEAGAAPGGVWKSMRCYQLIVVPEN